MAITLEELNVVLKSKSDQLRKDFKKVEKLGKKISKGLTKAFKKIPFGNAIKGAFSFKGAMVAAAGVAGVGLLIKKVAQAADNIAKMSKNLGVTSSFLQGLGFAATQSGVSVESMNASLLKFNRAIGEAAAGEKIFKDLFDAIGVSVTDTNGKIKGSEELFLEVSDGVAQLGTEAEQAALLMELFGRAGGKMINLMAGGSKVINKFRKEAEELGLILDDELLVGAEKITDQFDIMQRALTTQVSAAVLSLAPEIQQLTGALIDGARATAEYVKGFRLIVKSSRIFRGETKTLAENQAFLIQKEQELLQARKEVIEQSKQSRGKVGLFIELDQDRIDEINISLGKTRNAIRANIEKFKEEKDAITDVAKANKGNLEEVKRLIDLQVKAQEIVTKAGETPEKKVLEEIKILEEAKESKLKIEGDLNEALQTKRDEVAELKMEKIIQEIEAIRERNEILAELGDEASQKEIAANNKVIEEKKKKIKEGTDFSMKERIREKNAGDKFRDDTIKASGTFFSSMLTLSKGNSKALFVFAKAGALATATIDGVVAVQKALANPPGPPFSIPQAIAAGAQAAVNISRIAGTGFQKGIDKLPGIGSQDTIPIIAGPGEGIINRRGNEKLETFLDAQNIRPGAPADPVGVGPSRIVVSFDTDRLVDFVEARLVERGRLGTSLEVQSA